MTVRIEGETVLTVPIHLLGGIVCIGPVAMSPAIMSACAERGIGISFLTSNGHFQARVEGPISGNVLLRREQYRAADDKARALQLARGLVGGKIFNARQLLQRAARESDDAARAAQIDAAVDALRASLERVGQTETLDSLRGVEGDAAATYFGVFGLLIKQEGFSFKGRNRRPPKDSVNALLSFLYSMATHDASSALQATGLDPCVGYLHVDRPGRPSLALDLVEEFRTALADRVALSLINLRQVSPTGFTTEPTGEVRMTDATRKEVLVAYQKRKQEMVRHSFLNTDVPMGTVFHLQSRLLARAIRGDIDAYPPFVVK